MPALAPSSVSTNSVSATSITASVGISTRAKRSMPPFTPPAKMRNTPISKNTAYPNSEGAATISENVAS